MTANYLNLSIPAHVRLHYLRQAFAKRSKHSSAQSWRDMRYGKLTYPAGLAQGFNGTGRARVPVWFTCGGFEFPRQWFADEMEDAPRYVRNNRGWYCGEPGVHGLARGIVAARLAWPMSATKRATWWHPSAQHGRNCGRITRTCSSQCVKGAPPGRPSRIVRASLHRRKEP